MNLAVRAATDRGLRRPDNEDSVAYWTPEDGDDPRAGTLLVVADGMGGSRAGEVASQMAVETVIRTWREGGGAPLDRLRRALEAANTLVHQQSVAHPDLRGMGTTCTAAVVTGSELFVAHVGDSRAYVIDGGVIRQVTRDHSLVAQLVEAHQLTAEEARVDPRRNVVTRSVGVGPSVEVDAERIDVAAHGRETVLLCTDGLHGLVTDDEIAQLASGPDLDRACHDLIELAKERGGHDNISLIVARRDA